MRSQVIPVLQDCAIQLSAVAIDVHDFLRIRDEQAVQWLFNAAAVALTKHANFSHTTVDALRRRSRGPSRTSELNGSEREPAAL